MSKGRLILVPTALSESKPQSFLAEHSIQVIFETRHFIAERGKTARAFLKQIGYPIPMADIHVSELNKHGSEDYAHLLKPCIDGHDCGLMSEAGVPGVADPGGGVVMAAHKAGIEVVPLVGPSSILMALMSSGMNGQKFSFHGYLPKNGSELQKTIQSLEAKSQRESSTEIFIETPFRNSKLMDALLRILHKSTQVCVAVNITAHDQKISTKSVEMWKKSKLNFDRKPAVFLIYAGSEVK